MYFDKSDDGVSEVRFDSSFALTTKAEDPSNKNPHRIVQINFFIKFSLLYFKNLFLSTRAVLG